MRAGAIRSSIETWLRSPAPPPRCGLSPGTQIGFFSGCIVLAHFVQRQHIPFGSPRRQGSAPAVVLALRAFGGGPSPPGALVKRGHGCRSPSISNTPEGKFLYSGRLLGRITPYHRGRKLCVMRVSGNRSSGSRVVFSTSTLRCGNRSHGRAPVILPEAALRTTS